MVDKPKKKKYYVEDGETITSCLERIDRDGYRPVRRIEKPIFKEKGSDVEPAGREIMFDAVLKQ